MSQFDLHVHHYGKEGRVIRVNPYRLVIDSEGKRYERPVGSGMFYNEDGSLNEKFSAEALAKEENEKKHAAIEAAMAAERKKEEEAKLAAEKEAFVKAERAKMKAELLAEIAAEKKAGQNGASSKV